MRNREMAERNMGMRMSKGVKERAKDKEKEKEKETLLLSLIKIVY